MARGARKAAASLAAARTAPPPPAPPPPAPPSLSPLPPQADKRFQLADWRVRPLTPEMLHYARCDTHYLLYCHDRLRVRGPAPWPPRTLPPWGPARPPPAPAPGSPSALCEQFRQALGTCNVRQPALRRHPTPPGRAASVLWREAYVPPAHLSQAALLEAGDAVPEGLEVELPPGGQAAAAGGRGALATVLERSRR